MGDNVIEWLCAVQLEYKNFIFWNDAYKKYKFPEAKTKAIVCLKRMKYHSGGVEAYLNIQRMTYERCMEELCPKDDEKPPSE